MHGYVAVTDGDWFSFLAARPHLDEVNFWRPGSRAFSALTPGEPLIFKLHYPINKIVGWGFFLHAPDPLPLSFVWDAFGEKNGATSLAEMQARVSKYRRGAVEPDPAIGTTVLVEPTFLSPDRWIDAPADWSPNIVSGKRYDLASEPEGQRLWALIMTGAPVRELLEFDAPGEEVRFREVVRRERLGQGSFKTLVADAYGRRCAVSGERIMPILQAAHIRPVTEQGPHAVPNGVLLRSDIHRLFDDGYLSLDDRHRLMVSRRLRDDWRNGTWYYERAGEEILLPASVEDRPSQAFLEWHRDARFLG